jgi:phosphonate degradation associated HDIG domain protein
MNSEKAKEVAEEIISLYKIHGGSDYAGEPVTQLEHMVQAGILARKQGYDEDVILAAFLHDVGHISEAANGENEMDGFGIKDHEEIGAEFLATKGFSEKIVKLVGSHVEAKRYLTFADPEYYDQLSEASKTTLNFQGGVMKAEEARQFEKDPLFHMIIKMRKWDEEAKIVDAPMLPLEYFKTLIVEHLEKQNG